MATTVMTSPEAKQLHRTRHRLFKKYGITVGQYRDMVDAQGGLCLICDQPPRNGYRLSVDHNHRTGQIRGLLCGPCNLAIGNFGDDPEVALRASMYLLQNAERPAAASRQKAATGRLGRSYG